MEGWASHKAHGVEPGKFPQWWKDGLATGLIGVEPGKFPQANRKCLLQEEGSTHMDCMFTEITLAAMAQALGFSGDNHWVV